MNSALSIRTILVVSTAILSSAQQQISFSAANAYSQPWLGSAGTCWPGDTSLGNLIKDMQLTHVRLWVDCPNNAFDWISNRAENWEFDNIWKQQTGILNSVKQSAALLTPAGVKILILFKKPPASWTKDGINFKSEYGTAYARLIASSLQYFVNNGVKVAYVELFNEQDGDWDVKVSPADYAYIVHQTRYELNERGLQSIGVVGPGVSHMDDNNAYPTTLESSNLAAWSNHAYEWDSSINNVDGHKTFRRLWTAQADKFRSLRNLPIFVTEFATLAMTFHGTRINPPEARWSSPVYAAAVAKNIVELASGGASVAFVWQLADQSWDASKWGMQDGNGNQKPVYRAARSIFGLVPKTAKLLKPITQHSDMAGAVWLSQDGSLVLSLSNASPNSQTATVSIAAPTCQGKYHAVQKYTYSAGSDQFLTENQYVPVDMANLAGFNLATDSTVTIKYVCIAAPTGTTLVRKPTAVPSSIVEGAACTNDMKGASGICFYGNYAHCCNGKWALVRCSSGSFCKQSVTGFVCDVL